MKHGGSIKSPKMRVKEPFFGGSRDGYIHGPEVVEVTRIIITDDGT
jgi:hypothetical protein